MTDERSRDADDAWVDALEGKDAKDADDARLIRASIEAQDELTLERITDEDLEAAKQRLLARLDSDSDGAHASDADDPAASKVVDLSARRPDRARRSWWQQHPGMLLAASVAFVAIVVMVLRDPDVPDSQMLIMSYGEIDILRGNQGENVVPVADPDAFGRDLGATLIEREIPFVLTTDIPGSPDRIISIQVDGVRNREGVQQTLDELGLEQPSSSVVIVRLVPE